MGPGLEGGVFLLFPAEDRGIAVPRIDHRVVREDEEVVLDGCGDLPEGFGRSRPARAVGKSVSPEISRSISPFLYFLDTDDCHAIPFTVNI